RHREDRVFREKAPRADGFAYRPEGYEKEQEPHARNLEEAHRFADCLAGVRDRPDEESDHTNDEEERETTQEVRGRQLPEPPGEEEPVAEGRGADVEAEEPPLHP